MLVGAALITLAAAIFAELRAGESQTASTEPVAAALEPDPEGPVFTLSRGEPQWSELSLPARLPEPLPQTCAAGLNVVVTLADGTRIAYGPCRRPRVIELLHADLLGVAHKEDLLASVAPGCARRVIADWYDNARIDHLYRRVCYERALELLPQGWEDRSRMGKNIRRALCTWAVCDELSPSSAAGTRAPDELPASLALLCLPDAEPPPCGPGARVGVGYDHLLYTHCGVETTIFDGRLWLAQPPLNNGSGSPPPEWGNPIATGVMRLLLADEAEFRTGSLIARFMPAPPGYEREPCD